MTDSAGSFKAMILQWGPVPPSGGPLRLRYLDANGREALRIANEEYAAAMSILGDWRRSMPVMHTPHIELDESIRRQIQRQKRSEWIEYASTIPHTMLDELEPHVRLSESSAVAALNYLEDHYLAEVSHTAIHRAAFVRRGLYGCPITLRDGTFWTACAVNMSHLRMGLSAGMVADWECSICGRLVEDCDHAMGATYEKVATRDESGQCTICDAVECEHDLGSACLALASAHARNAVLEECSLVSRPRYPLARITERTTDLGALGDDPRVRQAAQQGELNCDGCLGPCKGFNEMSAWNLDEDRPREGPELEEPGIDMLYTDVPAPPSTDVGQTRRRLLSGGGSRISRRPTPRSFVSWSPHTQLDMAGGGNPDPLSSTLDPDSAG